MKLTYLLWGYPYDTAIIRTFREMGVMVEEVDLPRELIYDWNIVYEENHAENREDAINQAYACLKQQMRATAGDIVFSVNFFAWVSELCSQEAVPYCSWILQLPDFDLYTAAIKNPCNYLGVCDSYLTEKLWQMGIAKAFFLPDAIELGEIIQDVPDEREACFVAKHPKQVLNTEGMTLYGEGYLDAFIHAQRVLYGASILENGLIYRVQQEFLACNPIPQNILSEMQKLFMADRYFAPVCTGLQQKIFLQNFNSIMTIYSDGDFEECKAEKYPFPEEESKRRKIYAGKEFTLVLAPHVLHNGIPRDVLEVIAAGGFPISGFQRDYAYFFKKDENLVYFTNPTEFKQAIVRYGNSYEERERVRTAAYQAVAEGHTYQHRIALMMEMWGKL